MKQLLRDVIGGIVMAAVLIAYNHFHPAMQVILNDMSTVTCSIPLPPDPWQAGEL